MSVSRSPWPDPSTSVFWQPFQFTLAAGAQRTVTIAPQIPDRWMFAISAPATALVSVSVAPSADGFPMLFGPGGEATVPSNLDACTFSNVGPVSVTVTAVAKRGYEDCRLKVGELA